MFAIRLVQLIEAHADELSTGLMHRLQTSRQCTELLHRVPADELRRRVQEIYRNLSDWLLSKTDSGSKRGTSDWVCDAHGRACHSASSCGRST